MSDLTDFLLARIAEDEERAAAIHDAWDDKYDTGPRDADCACGVPARVLAECEATRRIVELHKPYQRIYGVGCDVCLQPRDLPADAPGWPCQTLRALALPHADHPDFRPEWRV